MRMVEGASVLLLIACGILLTVWAEPVMRYTEAAASELHSPRGYVDAVFGTEARPRAPSGVEEQAR